MYMVIFRTADGKPGYQQAEGVQDAVASVERLRNEDGVDNVRIFRMEEVAFEYKVHYSVELADVGESTPAATSAPASSPTAAPAPAPAPSGSADELAWDDDHSESAEPAAAPFDQMAVDPSGTPRWDDSTETVVSDEQEPATDDAPEPVASESDSRRGLFGR